MINWQVKVWLSNFDFSLTLFKTGPFVKYNVILQRWSLWMQYFCYEFAWIQWISYQRSFCWWSGAQHQGISSKILILTHGALCHLSHRCVIHWPIVKCHIALLATGWRKWGVTQGGILWPWLMAPFAANGLKNEYMYIHIYINIPFLANNSANKSGIISF